MDIAGLLITYKADISEVSSKIASLKSDMSGVADAAQSSSSGVVSAFKQIGNAADLGKAITGTDVAQAKLTLIQSEVTKAREKLQTLQNSADAGQAVKGIPEAQANLTLLEAKAQEARESLQQLNTATEETGQAQLSFGDRAQSMAGKLLNVGAQIGQTIYGFQALAQGAIGLGQSLLEPNASMEQTDVAFKQLLGSSSAATAELKDLQSFAASTPFEFPELADSTQKLLAFQYPLKQTKPLLTAIGDALSGLGENTAAKLDQVVSVFGQMKSSAHLMTGDVMQLTSVGINGFQILADQMHKPVSVIKDMLSSGLIPAGKGIEMLRVGMEKTFGGGMAAQAVTFNGLLSTFQDNIGAAWRTMTGPLFDAAKQGLEQMGNLVSSPAFQQFATTIGKDIGGALSTFTHNANIAIPVLSGIGAIIVAVLIPAMGTLAVEVVTATWPFLAIGAAVAGLVAIFMHFYNTNAGFKSFIDNIVAGLRQLWAIIVANVQPALKTIGDFIKTNVMPILQQVGAFLVSTFAPVWQQLVSVWNGQILPSLKQLWAALQPLSPILMFIGGVIAGVVIISFGLLVGILAGTAKAIAGLLGGLATFIGGIVQFVTGFVQVISGILQFIGDLLTGNFSKLGADLQTIWTGIGNMFAGIWGMIKGAFQAGVGVVVGLVSGFVDGVKGFFMTLYNDLVGHSIIPDMVNGIVNWIAQLPGRVMAFVSNLVAQAKAQFSAWMSAAIFIAGGIVNGVVGWFQQLPGRVGGLLQSMASTALGILNGLASSAWTAGMNVISQIAAGITAGIGTVTTAIGNVVATIASHLPQSPAKQGPLRALPQMGANITKQIGEGMLSAQPALQATMAHVVQSYPIRPSASSIAAAVAPSLAVQSGTGGHTTIIEMDGQQMMEYVQKLTEQKVKLRLSPGRRGGRVA